VFNFFRVQLKLILEHGRKSKLELESNSNKILPVNCKFIRGSTPTLTENLKLEYLKSGFKCKKEIYNHRQKFFCIVLLFFEYSSSL